MKRMLWWGLIWLGGTLLLVNCTNTVNKTESCREVVPVNMVVSDSVDSVVFHSIKSIVKQNGMDTLPLNQLILSVGKCFLQTPYVAYTLEGEGPEKLRINLDELDCTTFLETVMALSRVFLRDESDFMDFASELQYVRYRSGRIKDYSSRLHYFSDWFFENSNKGILSNQTHSIGGVSFNRKVYYMSSNSDKYLSLKSDSLMVEKIRAVELQINGRPSFYIPQDSIKGVESQILGGDVIALTSNIDGLDVSHVGFAVHVNGRLHLMHASSLEKKVVISDKPLAEMLTVRKNQTGIMVARVRP